TSVSASALSALGLGRVKTPALRARRRNSETLCIMKLSHLTKGRLHTLLENCIFYILPTYGFLYSQGHFRTSRIVQTLHSALMPAALIVDRRQCHNSQSKIRRDRP